MEVPVSSIRKRACLLPLLAWAAAPLLAGAVDINVSDDAVRAVYIAQFEEPGLELDFGWLHHTDDGDVGTVGLQVVEFGDQSTGSWNFGLGGKLFYVDSGGEDGSGLSLGGQAGYRPSSFRKFETVLRVFYASRAICFGDAEEFLDADLTAGFWLLPRGKIYVGVREVRADFENGSRRTIDRGIHLGLRIGF